MAIVSVAEYRAFDVLEAFAAIADPVVAGELEAAEEYLFGFLENRGYSVTLVSNVSVKRAICKVARVELLTIRGTNNLDPSAQLWVNERDRAVEWFEKKIAPGSANFVGTGAPERKRTGTARVFSPSSTTRGWTRNGCGE